MVNNYINYATSFTIFNGQEHIRNEFINNNLEVQNNISASELITVEKTNSYPERWAIRNGMNSCWSKKINHFCYERMPSSRDEDFFQEMRFETLDEAMKIGLEIAKVYEKAFSLSFGGGECNCGFES